MEREGGAEDRRAPTALPHPSSSSPSMPRGCFEGKNPGGDPGGEPHFPLCTNLSRASIDFQSLICLPLPPVPWFLVPPRVRRSQAPLTWAPSNATRDQGRLLCLGTAQPLGGPLHHLRPEASLTFPTGTRSFLPSPEAVKVNMPRHADLTAPKRKGFCQPFLRVSSSHQLPSRPALAEQRGTLAHEHQTLLVGSPTVHLSFPLLPTHPPCTPLRSPSPGPRTAKVRGSPSQEKTVPRFPAGQLPTAAPPGTPWILHLSPSPIPMTPPAFPLTIFSLDPPLLLGPNEERGQKFRTPSKARGHRRGGSGQTGARCPSLGASEGHTVARQPLLPLLPTWRPVAKAFVPGSEELVVLAATPVHGFPRAFSPREFWLREGVREERKGTL